MKVKIKTHWKDLPEYATVGSAGVDLKANLGFVQMKIKAGESREIPTGVYLEIPDGYECQIRGRSSLAFRYGVLSFNGTIDSDYRGEIKGLLFNTSKTDYHVHHGDRICQMVFNKIEQVEFERVEVLQETDRGIGGFGSTGK